MKKLLFYCCFCLFFAISMANASLINIEFNFGVYNYKVDIKSIDALAGEDSEGSLKQIKDDLIRQAAGYGVTEDTIKGLWGDGGNANLKGSTLQLSIAGEKIVIKVDKDDGSIKITEDGLGLFDDMDFTGLILDNFDSFIKSANGNFAERLEVYIKDLINNGNLYAILSKTFVKETKRKIKDTGISAIGGNPLSLMYQMADYDFNLAVNDNKVDSVSYPQIYMRTDGDYDVLQAQLPLNMSINMFGLLDKVGLSLRFDLPLSFTQMSNKDNKIYGGTLGLGVALRWIVPEQVAYNWSITPSIRFNFGASFNDKLTDLDEDAINSLDDLSILPELSIFRSIGVVSKKEWTAQQFKIDSDKVFFTMTNSFTIVDSLSKSTIETLASKAVKLDDKTKKFIPEFDLHNQFFKNGLMVTYQPYSRLLLRAGLAYTIVFGSTDVYVPNYWNINFDVGLKSDLWIFDDPYFRINLISGSNSWGAFGIAIGANF